MDDGATASLSSCLVVIPWRPGAPERTAALNWVLAQWGATGLPVTLGTHHDGPWCKAAAVADALRGSTAEHLIIADADVWAPHVLDALQLVEAGAAWAIPHYLLYRLDENATRALIRGKVNLTTRLPLDGRQKPYKGFAGGGMVVIQRDAYDACPLDPRFLGWGHEDESWGKALDTLYGRPKRLPHPMWHLWHPPQERITWGLGSVESFELFKRYNRHWRRDPEGMRRLIEEGRQWTSTKPAPSSN